MGTERKPHKRNELDVAAQEAFYSRQHGPVAGEHSVTQSPEKLAALQRIGVIPKRFTSWEQINDEFRHNVEVLGLSEQATRNKLNLNVKNTNGKYYFSKYERYGPGNYINFREISTDLQPEATADLLRIGGRRSVRQGPRMASSQQMLEDAVFAEEDEWGDRPKNKHDPNIISSKEKANATRDALRARLGGPLKGSPDVFDSGKQIHRGHGFAASKSNAGLGIDNIWDELGSYNVYGHAGKSNNPRVHPDILHDVYAPPTAEHAAWYRQIRDQRLFPGVPDQLMMAADEYGSQIYGSRGSGRGKTYDVGPATVRGGPINTPPATVPAKADKVFQLSSQLAEEKVAKEIKKGLTFPGGELERAQARAAYTEKVRSEIAKLYLDQQSINLDPTSSPNTPITKGTYTFTEKDFTPLQWKEFIAGGGNEAIASGRKASEVIEQGRVARRMPKSSSQPNDQVQPRRIITTRSQSLGRTAGAIATREPVPTPIPAQPKQIRTEAELDRIFANAVKPAPAQPVSGNFVPKGPVNITPTAKERALAAERAGVRSRQVMARSSAPQPMPKPAAAPPKVGQPAILNGQAVMWSGGGWVKIPTPKAMKPTAKPKPAVAKPATKPKPATRSSSSGTRMPSSNQPATRSRGASPLNRGSAAFGGIERQTNEAMPDMFGTSPFTLRLAD